MGVAERAPVQEGAEGWCLLQAGDKHHREHAEDEGVVAHSHGFLEDVLAVAVQLEGVCAQLFDDALARLHVVVQCCRVEVTIVSLLKRFVPESKKPAVEKWMGSLSFVIISV